GERQEADAEPRLLPGRERQLDRAPLLGRGVEGQRDGNGRVAGPAAVEERGAPAGGQHERVFVREEPRLLDAQRGEARLDGRPARALAAGGAQRAGEQQREPRAARAAHRAGQTGSWATASPVTTGSPRWLVVTTSISTRPSAPIAFTVPFAVSVSP